MLPYHLQILSIKTKKIGALMENSLLFDSPKKSREKLLHNEWIWRGEVRREKERERESKSSAQARAGEEGTNGWGGGAGWGPCGYGLSATHPWEEHATGVGTVEGGGSVPVIWCRPHATAPSSCQVSAGQPRGATMVWGRRQMWWCHPVRRRREPL